MRPDSFACLCATNCFAIAPNTHLFTIIVVISVSVTIVVVIRVTIIAVVVFVVVIKMLTGGVANGPPVRPQWGGL